MIYHKQTSHKSIDAWLEPSTKQGVYEFYSVRQTDDTSNYYHCMVFLDGISLRVWLGYGYYIGMFCDEDYTYNKIMRKDRYLLKTLVNSCFRKNMKPVYMNTEFHYYQKLYKKTREIQVELGFTHTFDKHVKQHIKNSICEPWIMPTTPVLCNEIIEKFKLME